MQRNVSIELKVELCYDLLLKKDRLKGGTL